MSDLYARLAAFLDARLDREEFLARNAEQDASTGPSLLAAWLTKDFLDRRRKAAGQP